MSTSAGRSRKSLRPNRPTARRQFRRPGFELLEPRQMLAAPTLGAIGTITLTAGAPLHIVLDGYDADGDTLTYTVSSTNPALAAAICPRTNDSLRITMDGFGTGGTDGVMEFHLFEDLAPRTTSRIIQLAESGFYDGLTFHRVVKDFMIQGGDPEGDGTGGSGVDFDDEFNPKLLHTSTGLLSMAKSGDDTNDSQFFITGSMPRYLDFNHTVFGFLTRGESVRQAIENVAVAKQDPTNANSEVSRPVDDVTMKSVEVFTDRENGVLRLSAPEGSYTSGSVTVTVSDGNGGTASRTFEVNILPENSPYGDSYPYLLPITPIETSVNKPVTFQIPASDVEGNQIRYEGEVLSQTSNLNIQVNPTTGVVTLTPSGNIVGVYAVGLYVRPENPTGYFDGRDVWDSQAVPVLIHPAAPTGIELLAGSDTGLSNSDGVTSANNSGGAGLSFRVSGVLAGAQVIVYADGQAIGTAVATSDSVVIVTNGTAALADGTHAITAQQLLLDLPVNVGNLHQVVDLGSVMSAPLQIKIDTANPQFTSVPVLAAARDMLYQYNVQTNEEAPGKVEYRLVQSPAGMIIDHATGVITWTPRASAATVSAVTVRAKDAAGNEADQQFTITLGEPPQLEPVADQEVTAGQPLVLAFSATGNQTPLTYRLLPGAPAGATVNPQSGVFAWTPRWAQGPGQYAIGVEVVDSLGLRASRTFQVAVAEAEGLPPSSLIFIQSGANQGGQTASRISPRAVIFGSGRSAGNVAASGPRYESSSTQQGRWVLGDTGLFGTQIGAIGGGGGSAAQPPAKDERAEQPSPAAKPEAPARSPAAKPESSSGEGSQAQQPTRRSSDRIPLGSEAIDAAMELLD